MDNQKMLSKITTVKSHYPIKTLKDSAKKNNKLKTNIMYNSSNLHLLNNTIDRFERNNYFLNIAS